MSEVGRNDRVVLLLVLEYSNGCLFHGSPLTRETLLHTYEFWQGSGLFLTRESYLLNSAG